MRDILPLTTDALSDQVIFGSDWPMCRVQDHSDLIRDLGLDEVTHRNVLAYKPLGSSPGQLAGVSHLQHSLAPALAVHPKQYGQQRTGKDYQASPRYPRN